MARACLIFFSLILLILNVVNVTRVSLWDNVSVPIIVVGALAIFLNITLIVFNVLSLVSDAEEVL